MTGVQISRPGAYERFGTARFDGHERASVPVALRDRVRIAIDLAQLTVGGMLRDEPLSGLCSHD
jgi:hypothetical protein